MALRNIKEDRIQQIFDHPAKFRSLTAILMTRNDVKMVSGSSGVDLFPAVWLAALEVEANLSLKPLLSLASSFAVALFALDFFALSTQALIVIHCEKYIFLNLVYSNIPPSRKLI